MRERQLARSSILLVPLCLSALACGGGGGGGGSSSSSSSGGGSSSSSGVSGSSSSGGSSSSSSSSSGGSGSSSGGASSGGVAGEITCQELAPLASGTCEVTSGGAERLLVGTVLTPGTIYRGGQVLVDAGGTIAFVGCGTDCDADPTCRARAASATAITCPQGVISPGLINTHDHLGYTGSGPVADTGERYDDRHQWRLGLCGHTRISVTGNASPDVVAWGELRFLFGGATSTVGAAHASGLLRNLDFDHGLQVPPVDAETFPLGDSNPPGSLCSGAPVCSAYTGAVSEAAIAADHAYLAHVAEGVDAPSAAEFACLSAANPGHDIVVAKSAFVQGVGLTAADFAEMAASGTALVWSPRSNLRLYGDTAAVAEASRLGVLIALGTDWLPTGSMNLLRELRCADSLNRNYYDRAFTDRDLWMMVTANAAAVAGVDGSVGVLQRGKLADVAVFDGSAHHDYRAVIDAEPQDVALVLRGGTPLYGEARVLGAVAGSACDTLEVCGATKQVCLTDEIGKGWAALSAAVGGAYRPFSCGAPEDEPTCTPGRAVSVAGSTVYTGERTATDSDGDGIPDEVDDCPHVFNPVRPMDGGVQADADGDGVGDACDPCPLDPNTTSCASHDPNDSDGDGIPDWTDDCPGVANPDQQDTDHDGKGDACDACPNASNPGGEGCPTPIYAIKQGLVPAGATVALLDQLVTGRTRAGYYLQVKPGDPDYDTGLGAAWSGIYVYDPSNAVAIGDRVTLSSATVADDYGQVLLVHPTATVVASLGEASPPPTTAAPAALATGGSLAAAYESVLVRVDDVSVTSVAPPLGAGDTAPSNEFVVDGSLRIDDALYLVSPFPAVGQGFDSITGLLTLRNGDSKLEPRDAADVLPGTAVLASFGPASSFVDAGALGEPTGPTPLTVTLASAAPRDTFVAVTSGDPGSLTVVGGGVTVPAGETSWPVLVNGLASSPSVTLTAALGGVSLDAAVRVIGLGEQPELASLEPATSFLSAGSTATFTVTLDIPARAAGEVVALAVSPASAGTVPATVTIPAGQQSATFDYVDAAQASGASITATLGKSEATADLTLQSGKLVLNEVDYDSVGDDTTEFAELYNAGTAPVPLTNLFLVLVNGNGGITYDHIDLGPAGTLQPGQYLVWGASSVVAALPAGVLTLDGGSGGNLIQNGSPDGVLLWDAARGKLLDALSYEGFITTATGLPLTGTVSLVEGTVLPSSVQDVNTAPGSLCRMPNGSDTNDAATDWTFCATPTPGAANLR